MDSSQAPFKLFPVTDHHIHCSSFKRTHSSQFKKSLSSSLQLVFFDTYSYHEQTRLDSSQAPFKLFPVTDHHIHCSSFKWTHSRQFQSCPSSVIQYFFFLFSTRFHLKHHRNGFHRIQNRLRLNLHVPNQGCEVFTTKPSQFLLKTSPKLSQLRFEGGVPRWKFPGKTTDLPNLFLTQDRRVNQPKLGQIKSAS